MNEDLRVYDFGFLTHTLATATGKTINVSGNMTIGDGTNVIIATGATNDPNISVTSNVIVANNATFTNTDDTAKTLNIDGDLTITGIFTAPNGTGATAFTLGGDFTNNGTFNHSDGMITFDTTAAAELTYSADTTFYKFNVPTSAASKNIQFDEAQTTIIANDITIQGTNCTGNRIFLDSYVNDNLWSINLNTGATQSINYIDLEDAYATDSEVTLVADDSTETGANTDWTVNAGACGGSGITIAGTSDKSSGETVKVAVNGALQDGKTDTIAGDGTWSISTVSVASGNIVTVWVDSMADSAESTAVTKYDGDGDIANMVLNNNVLSVGSDDTGVSVTVANLGQYDCTDNEDVMHNASTVATLLEVEGTGGTCVNSYASEKIDILAADTLTVGGTETLTTHDIAINGSLTSGGASTYNISGFWDNNTDFNSSSETINFTSTGTETIDSTGASDSDIYNVVFNGSGGQWTLTTALVVNNKLTSTAGTIVGTQNLTIGGGDFVCGATCGSISLTGGTTNLSGTGNFGTDGKTYNWTFYDLTFGDGAAEVSTSQGTGTITVSNVLTIAGSHELNAGNKTWTLSKSGTGAGKPLVATGTFTASTSTVSYEGAAATDVTLVTYNNLTTNAAGPFTAEAGTLTVNGNITASAGTFNLNGTTNVAGNVSIESGAALVSTSGILTITGNYSNLDTFTHNSGTVTFDAADTGNTLSGTMTGTSKFNNLIFNNAAGAWSFGSNDAEIANDFTITASETATSGVTVPSGALTITGNYANTAGRFTHNSGTATFNATDAGNTLTGTMTGTSSFCDLIFNNSNGGWILGSGTLTIDGNFTIIDGTVTAEANDPAINIGGDLTVDFDSDNNGSFAKGDGVLTFNDNWLSGWDNRIQLTIDHTNVDSNLSDFPTSIYLSTSSGIGNTDVSAVFDELTSNDNRKKIAITASNGTTECYVEIEKWDDTNEQAWLWVKVPSIDSSSGATIYLYYDVDHADNTTYVDDTNTGNSHNVWDTNYQGVYHLAEVSGIRYDSTNNNNDLTDNNTVLQDTGKIGKSAKFETAGSPNEYLSKAEPTSLDINGENQPLSVSCWINRESDSGATEYPVAKYDTTASDRQYALHVPTEDNMAFRLSSDGTAQEVANSLAIINTGTWYHIGGVYDDTDIRIYIDGDLSNNGALNPMTYTGGIADKSASFKIGARDPSNYWDGLVDEVRVSDIDRPAAWIKADYNSGNDSLVTFGDSENDWTDNNSTKSDMGNVTINGDINLGSNVKVTDLTINATKTLDATTSNHSMNIGGDWDNNGTFTCQEGTVTFDGTGTHTITDGSSVFYNIKFDAAATSWTYTDEGTTIATNSTELTTNVTGTVNFINARTGASPTVTAGTLNVDWYLGIHAVNANGLANIETDSTTDIKISENTGTPVATIWKYSSGWGSPATSQTTGTDSTGKNIQPHTDGAIKIREYSNTAGARTDYLYNLQIIWQTNYGAYDYYDDYGENYLTSTLNTSSGHDEIIDSDWHRETSVTMNADDTLNDVPTYGSWYVGMLTGLSVDFTTGASITFDDLNSTNNFSDTDETKTQITVSTSATSGYVVTAWEDGLMTCSACAGTPNIQNFYGTYPTPQLWSDASYCKDNSNFCGFGFTSSDTTIDTFGDLYVGATKYAGFPNGSINPIRVMDYDSPANGIFYDITYRISISNTQQSGDYSTTIVYIVTAEY